MQFSGVCGFMLPQPRQKKRAPDENSPDTHQKTLHMKN